MKTKIEFQLPADLRFSSVVRDVSATLFRTAHFPPGWCGRLKLVLDELFMNAVKYGSASGGLVRLVFEFDDAGIAVTVEDEGKGAKPVTPEALQTLIAQNKEAMQVTHTSGRGLAMIADLWTNGVTFARSSLGGLAVTFFKKVEITPPPAIPMPLPGGQQAPAAKPVGKIVTVRINSDVDHETVDAVAAVVTKQLQSFTGGETLNLDFSGVQYINSLFIGHLADWYNRLSQLKGAMQLRHVSPPVRDVLNLVGLDRVIPLA